MRTYCWWVYFINKVCQTQPEEIPILFQVLTHTQLQCLLELSLSMIQVPTSDLLPLRVLRYLVHLYADGEHHLGKVDREIAPKQYMVSF